MHIIWSPLFYSVLLPALAFAVFSLTYFSAVPSTPASYELSKPRTAIVKLERKMPVVEVTLRNGQYAPWEIPPARQITQPQKILQEKEERRLQKAAIYKEQMTAAQSLPARMTGLL